MNVVKDDLQPTQFRVFDDSVNELFKIVNCCIDPFILMNWNVEECLNSFPLRTLIKSLKHTFLIYRFT